MALLHAVARMAAELNDEQGLPEGQGGQTACHVLALHVHHGLSTQADAWLLHVRTTCESWAAKGLPVSVVWKHVTLNLQGRRSVEALARQARYGALAEMAHAAGCDAVMLAHHQRDQAETFLLQAFRSAGAAGLSAMPRQAERNGINWLRPWLERPRAHIEAYVAHHRLAYVDDDSNQNTRFDRNRLRLEVWPALSAAFGNVEGRLARAAAHQQDLKACLDDWLRHKLPMVTHHVSGRLSLDSTAWLQCEPGPQRELLRAWFLAASGASLPLNGVHRLQADLLRLAARSGGEGIKGVARWPWPGGERLADHAGEVAPSSEAVPLEVVLYRGLLSLRPADAQDGESRQPEPAIEMPPGGLSISIVSCGDVLLPAGLGHLAVRWVGRGGVALDRLSCAQLTLRRGGEQFQAGRGRPPRSLKKQFQMIGVPAWARHGPLLYVGHDLVFVPGLGIDARAWAREGEPQVEIHWQPTQIGVKFDHTCFPDAKRPVGG